MSICEQPRCEIEKNGTDDRKNPALKYFFLQTIYGNNANKPQYKSIVMPCIHKRSGIITNMVEERNEAIISCNSMVSLNIFSYRGSFQVFYPCGVDYTLNKWMISIFLYICQQNGDFILFIPGSTVFCRIRDSINKKNNKNKQYNYPLFCHLYSTV